MVLKLERNSLEYLLKHFCGVAANKEYQNADWRLRPLPDEMLRYAKADTYYLLYIYDMMKIKLFSMPKEFENSDAPLIEVYKRSYDICMQLYEKDLLTENSYLYIYGLQGAGLNAHQLAIVAASQENLAVNDEPEVSSPGTFSELKIVNFRRESIDSCNALGGNMIPQFPAYPLDKEESLNFSSVARLDSAGIPSVEHPDANGKEKKESGSHISELSNERFSISGQSRDMNSSTKVTGATVQALKKPSNGFGALLGPPKKKFDTEANDKEETKLEQIRSSVNPPFQSEEDIIMLDEECELMSLTDLSTSFHTTTKAKREKPKKLRNLKSIVDFCSC